MKHFSTLLRIILVIFGLALALTILELSFDLWFNFEIEHNSFPTEGQRYLGFLIFVALALFSGYLDRFKPQSIPLKQSFLIPLFFLFGYLAIGILPTLIAETRDTGGWMPGLGSAFFAVKYLETSLVVFIISLLVSKFKPMGFKNQVIVLTCIHIAMLAIVVLPYALN